MVGEMGAPWAWARSELRQRRRANVALALLIGLSGAVVLTTAAGADRTATAFARFLESSDTADVEVQYSKDNDADGDGIIDEEEAAAATAFDADVLAAFQARPELEVATPLYFTVGFSDVTDFDLLVVSGPERALFRDVDRLRVLEGRRPRPDAVEEVMLTRFMQEILDAEVDDTVTIGTFSAEQFGAEAYDEPPAGPVLELRVVGIGTFPFDVADEAFGAAIATPAFFDAYAAEAGGFGPSIEVLARDGFDAMAVAKEVASDFQFDELFYTPSSQLSLSVEDGTNVLVVGLWAFTGVGAFAFLVATAQALRRRMDATGRDQPTLSALGLDRLQRPWRSP